MEHKVRCLLTLADKSRECVVGGGIKKRFLKQGSFKLDVGGRREGHPGFGSNMGQSWLREGTQSIERISDRTEYKMNGWRRAQRGAPEVGVQECSRATGWLGGVPRQRYLSWTAPQLRQRESRSQAMQGLTSQTKGPGIFSWDSGKPLQDVKEESDGSGLHFRNISHQAVLWRRGLKQLFSGVILLTMGIWQ